MKEDSMKTSVFISIMGHEIYDILKSLTVPEKPSAKTFNELLKILRNHFAPRKNKRAERYKFNKAVQQSGESINEFIVRLKSLAQTCKFGEFKTPAKVTEKAKKETEAVVDNVSNYKMLILDEALTDRFIVGLSNSKIQQRLLDKDELTFEECCLLATNMELAEKESQAIQPKSFVNKVTTFQSQSKSKLNNRRGRSKSRSREVKDSVDKECRRCGRLHNPNTCPAVNWKCFVCQKTGHTSKMCYNKESKGNTGKANKQKSSYHPYIRSFAVDKTLGNELIGINVVKREKFQSERFFDCEPLECQVNIENQKVSMEVDSGAAATVMCEQEYRESGSSVSNNDSPSVGSGVHSGPNASCLDSCAPLTTPFWYNCFGRRNNEVPVHENGDVSLILLCHQADVVAVLNSTIQPFYGLDNDSSFLV
ncbi:hypothetical protein Bhyg_02307 [Pseudolycoriella hygida]|uniref:CCHC-type domain-containing protein n=1 Tax=Pseudolycoriella hygida TaxID=35572 RepID=A0A9Q0NB84_9DIPT|nr:hypothetical protein Bhyg_02307 [Pseudolycoriella hygida]